MHNQIQCLGIYNPLFIIPFLKEYLDMEIISIKENIF
jgi:hypothetical protein